MKCVIKIIVVISLLILTACSRNIYSKSNDSSNSSNSSSSVVEQSQWGLKNEPILLASVPDKHIYLYGLWPNGMVLYNNNYGKYFNWVYNVPASVPPKMAVADFDHNGDVEIAITLLNRTGTGLSAEDLHVLKMKPDIANDGAFHGYYGQYAYTDFIVDDSKSESQLEKNIVAKYEPSSKELQLRVSGKSYSIDISDTINEGHKFNSVFYTNKISYKFDGSSIYASFGVDYTVDDGTVPIYVGNVNAKVNFENGVFTLSDFWLNQDID